MKAEVIIDHETQKVKLVFDWQGGGNGKLLTADEAEKVTRLIEETTQQAGREAFRQWWLRFECDADVLEVNGKKYRFKMISEKTFLTKCGHVAVSRRIFPQDAGGKTCVPLDVAWEMVGETMTRDVCECVLYMSALMSPTETEACLQKVAAFQPSRTVMP